MGDSGSEDTSDSYGANMGLTDAEVSAATGGDQGTTFGVNGISATGSTAMDEEIGYSDGRGGPGDNFGAFGGITDSEGNAIGKSPQSPSEFSAALSATQGTGGTPSDSTPSISVPSIQAAGVSPTFSGVGVSDVFDPTVDVDRSGKTAPSAIEQAAASYDAIPASLGFLPAEVTKDTLPSITGRTDTTQKTGLAGLADAIGQANKDRAAAAGIDFGVAAPAGITAGISPAPPGFEEQVGRDPNVQDGISYNMLGAPGTSGADFDVDEAMEIAGRTAESIVGDDFGPALDMVDSRTTAPGAEDPFDPNVGRPFDVGKLEQMEAIMAQPNVMPGMFGLVEDRTKDALATSIALGRNLNPIEAVFGYTAPNMAKDKETIKEYNARTGAFIPADQLVTDTQGVVIGIKDAMGNLITGRDPSAQETDQGSESGKERIKPKAPTDPCPEGYQLIDGKCTPIAEAATGTGFQVFPANRNPAYRTGPFSPATVATGAGGIRGLNPITFNPFNK